jgi:replicative DNA helicase
MLILSTCFPLASFLHGKYYTCMNSLKIPPQSQESEKALLGAIMLRPEAIYDVVDIIGPESFYATKNKLIFQSMLELMNKGIEIDALSISEKLKSNGDFDKAGGKNYMAELLDSVPSSSNIKHYADIVLKKKLMRELIMAADHLSSLGYDETRELEEILDEAEKKIFAVTNVQATGKYVELKGALSEAFERLDKLHKSSDAVRGVPTGFNGLDNMLSGFQKSDLIILAARPSMGKTALSLDIARKVALNHKVPVIFFSLEMSHDQLVDRVISAESAVDGFKIRTGKGLKETDFEKIGNAISNLSDAPFYIEDTSGLNIIQMKSMLRRIMSEKVGEGNKALVIVDYLQLMTPTNMRTDNIVAQITEISRSLKGMAKEFNVPVIALSQLSRAVEARGGKPRLSDLRDSGAIEQDADVVMFIHRERNEDEAGRENKAQILIEKHRNGPVGYVDLYFDDKKASFLDVDKSHSDPLEGGF